MKATHRKVIGWLKAGAWLHKETDRTVAARLRNSGAYTPALGRVNVETVRAMVKAGLLTNTWELPASDPLRASK